MIKAIGFDYGGVFVTNSGPHVADFISKLIGVPAPDIKKEYFKNNHLGNVEGIPYREVWSMVAQNLSGKDNRKEIYDFFHQREASQKFDDRMLSLVDNLHANGYKVGLLSNNSLEMGQHTRSIGLDKHFESFVISAEVGLQKPNPEIFRLLYDQLGVPATESAFIDDSEQSLKTANEVGFVPILFTTYEALLEKLSELDIKHS
jgi:epoxide hydrolase-like predicted phosphatase